MLGSIEGVVEKARVHAQERGISEAELLQPKLADDMWPLSLQVKSIWAHSSYAIEQVKSGEFRPTTENEPKN